MENKLTLYHASLDLDPIEVFVPRVPVFTDYGEDDEIPRICLSETINGCLSATDWGGPEFYAIVHCSEISQLIRIYEFDITDDMMKNIEFPSTLYQRDLVRGAEINKEYWYKNDTLKPSRNYLIKVTYHDEILKDRISFEDLVKVNNSQLPMTEVIGL